MKRIKKNIKKLRNLLGALRRVPGAIRRTREWGKVLGPLAR